MNRFSLVLLLIFSSLIDCNFNPKSSRTHAINVAKNLLLPTTVIPTVFLSYSKIKNIKDVRAIENMPEITSKVYIDIKIANYTEESVGQNRAASGSGRIVFGLYGKNCPKACENFISLITGDGDNLPSLKKSLFNKVTEDGLLLCEKVSKVNNILLAGNEQYEYQGQLLPTIQSFVEINTDKLSSHNGIGLLTHRQGSGGGEFGITLKPAPQLDSFHEIFGTVLEGYEVLDAISAIPTYSYKTKTGYAGQVKGIEGDAADAWFEGQKKFYVGLAKSFGDKRAVDQRGKLLRRVSIKNCGLVL